MKKYRYTIIIIILLAIVAAFLFLNNRSGTMLKKENEFAVSDTSNVTKIFMADKENNKVKLERVAGSEWKLNDRFSASSDNVNIMLKTLLRLEVKSPVAKNARNNIIRLLAAKSVKVEVYQMVYRINLFDWIMLFPHEKKTKTYYVGDPTPNNMGTYMLMEGSEDPYVVYIPGFRGFVTTRYSAIETDWRNHAIFNSRLPDIKQVSMEFSDVPENSFSISNSNNRNFTLKSLTDNRIINDYDTLKVIQFLGSFHKVNFEAFVTDLTQKQQDSVTTSTPNIVISLDDNFGKQFQLKVWRIKAGPGETDLMGNPVSWNRDRLYAQITGTKDLVTIQYFIFDNILRPLKWFTDKSPSPGI